jgi:hypothetical protein
LQSGGGVNADGLGDEFDPVNRDMVTLLVTC